MEKMKLAAIINVWADCNDLLDCCVESARLWADEVIVVWSSVSNYGERTNEIPKCSFRNAMVCNVHIDLKLDPRANETKKRNFGLSVALENECTHFVTMDADEVYSPEDVSRVKELFDDTNLNGLVVPCQTYFAHPWLTIGRDTTLVPFIHKLNPDTRHGFNRSYPFAWIDGKIRIDPTRSLSYTSGIIHTESVVMHHYSWIRSDYQLKIRNSTARANIERSTILNDLACAKEGYFCQFYGKTLVRTDVDFGIPDLSPAQYVSKDFLQSDQKAVHKPGSD